MIRALWRGLAVIGSVTCAHAPVRPVVGVDRCTAPRVTVAPHARAEAIRVIASTTQLGGAPGIAVENTRVDDVEASCGE
jgi:hypothetical protein